MIGDLHQFIGHCLIPLDPLSYNITQLLISDEMVGSNISPNCAISKDVKIFLTAKSRQIAFAYNQVQLIAIHS